MQHASATSKQTINQNASAVNSATPLLIQWLCCWSVLSSNIMMKFVLCPVVDSVPARVRVLYLQQHGICKHTHTAACKSPGLG